MTRLFDCFTFFNELDVLELRLKELSPLVHRFVLVESDKTFTGNDKPLHFDENKERFAPYLNKIEHVIVRDMPPAEASAWDRETFQRDAILRGLSSADSNDLVMVGDVDEIPKPQILCDVLRNPATAGSVTTLATELHLYFLNLRSKPVYTSLASAPRLIRRRYLASPQALRRHKPTWRKGKTSLIGKSIIALRIRKKFGTFLQNKVIENGAWHFTFLGGADAIRKKLTSYSHTEVLRDELLDIGFLESMLKKRQFIFEGDMDLSVVEDWSELPQTLSQEREKWQQHFVPAEESE